MMNLEIRHCEPDELATVIERLDQEFIFGKRRSLSMRDRFCNALSMQNIEHIRVATLDGKISGILVISTFDWFAEGTIWHGARIGMVWVDPRLRNQGIGTKLIVAASEFLQEKKNVDFGVLWTGAPAFYRRGGWILSDQSLFGEMLSHSVPRDQYTVACGPLCHADVSWLEDLRTRFESQRVLRSESGYETIPIPSARVLCLSVRGSADCEGFALVGEAEEGGYFYEMVAPPILWDLIWGATSGRFERLFVNGRVGAPFATWLAEHNYVSWQTQSKTMWLCVSDKLSPSIFSTWHIPYFDRI
jgi:predicted N-acetyltransferase YhbS